MSLVKFRLGHLADTYNADLHGDPETLITGLAPLGRAQAGQLTYLSDNQYRKLLPTTRASAVILSPDDLPNCPTHALVSDNPRACYAKIATLFLREPTTSSGIHATTQIGKDTHIAATVNIGPNCVIGDRVTIDEDVIIGAGCIIGDDVTIGKKTRLWANVTIYYGVSIGQRTIVHSGAVIGADGFGMVKDDDGTWLKVPQLGSVVIEDDVEIGVNTSIDRGTFDNTHIASGVKLDNQIQVAHNVRIGKHTLIAACTGISGSVEIGEHCIIAGGVGFRDHIKIADNVFIMGMSRVDRSITEPGGYASGTSIQPFADWNKNRIRFHQLNKMARLLNQLQKQKMSNE